MRVLTSLLATAILACAQVLFLVLSATPLTAEAQPARKAHRVGVLFGGSRSPTFESRVRFMAEELRAQRGVDGETIVLEYRCDEGKRERLPALAAELVELKVSVIVAVGTPAALAAKRATPTIPVVMVQVSDPVGSGLVASLRRPGGNVTGMAFLYPEFTTKQVELLKELVPEAEAFGVMFDPLNPAQVDLVATTIRAAGTAARLAMHPIEVGTSTPLETVFAEVVRKRLKTLLVLPLNRGPGWIQDVATLAVGHRLVTLGTFRDYAEQGMLVSFAPRAEEQFQRAAVYINRILGGARPSELPIEQPTRFDLVINMKTAKAVGLTVPATVLLRAEAVIE